MFREKINLVQLAKVSNIKNVDLFVLKACIPYAERERCTHTLHGWMASFYQKARQSTIH